MSILSPSFTRDLKCSYWLLTKMPAYDFCSDGYIFEINKTFTIPLLSDSPSSEVGMRPLSLKPVDAEKNAEDDRREGIAKHMASQKRIRKQQEKCVRQDYGIPRGAVVMGFHRKEGKCRYEEQTNDAIAGHQINPIHLCGLVHSHHAIHEM